MPPRKIISTRRKKPFKGRKRNTSHFWFFLPILFNIFFYIVFFIELINFYLIELIFLVFFVALFLIGEYFKNKYLIFLVYLGANIFSMFLFISSLTSEQISSLVASFFILLLFIPIFFYLVLEIKFNLSFKKKFVNIFVNLNRKISKKIRIYRNNKAKYKEIKSNYLKDLSKIKNDNEKKIFSSFFLDFINNWRINYSIENSHVKRIELKENSLLLDEDLKKSFFKRISQFKNLEILNLSGLNLKSIDFLSDFEWLISLNLSNNNIEKITVIKNLNNLRNLDLHLNEITEIENLDVMTKLVYLDLSKNRIKEIKNLDNLKNLEELKLSDNFINIITGLEKLFKLKSLYISNNQITRIPNFESNFDLRYLDISNNYIEKIENLEALKDLKFLDLSNNKIENIENLEQNSYLRNLNLSKNKISEIKSLEHLKNLISIYLANNQIKELKGLGLINLKEWDLTYNPLSEQEQTILNYPPKRFIKYNLGREIKIPEIEKESKPRESITSIKESQIYDFLFIIPLREEFEIFYKLIEIKEEVNLEETQFFTVGIPNESYNGLALYLGEPGLTKAVQITEKFLGKFKVRLVVLLGIAGALDENLKIGDIVVPNEISDFLSNSKAIQKGDYFKLEYSGNNWRIQNALMECIKHFEFSEQKSIYDYWRKKTTRNYNISNLKNISVKLNNYVSAEPSYFIGHIASSNTVVASKSYKIELKGIDRKFLAVEMEGAGVARACQDRKKPVPFLMIRGISDFSDERKKILDKLQKGILHKYAMNNAINFFLSLIKMKCMKDFLS